MAFWWTRFRLNIHLLNVAEFCALKDASIAVKQNVAITDRLHIAIAGEEEIRKYQVIFFGSKNSPHLPWRAPPHNSSRNKKSSWSRSPDQFFRAQLLEATRTSYDCQYSAEVEPFIIYANWHNCTIIITSTIVQLWLNKIYFTIIVTSK